MIVNLLIYVIQNNVLDVHCFCCRLCSKNLAASGFHLRRYVCHVLPMFSWVEQSAIEFTRRKTQFSELQAPAENSLVYC